MNGKIRWGILGTGRIARTFCGMLNRLEQAEVRAVGSRSLETAEAFGREYGIQNRYGSYEDFVWDEETDIIYVATPIGSHYENVKLCLEAGKHVLCEKALTRKAAEAEELYALAREKQLFLMEAMWSKCHPVFQKLMQWKREGAFGEIQGVDARFYTAAGRSHRLYKDRNQGGTLYDLSIYPLTYACALLGYEPAQITARAAQGGDNVDVMETIQLLYENGAFASLTGGLACDRQMSLYIHGTKGRVLIEKEYFHKAEHVTLMDWENRPIETFDGAFQENGYEYEALEAMDCIAGGRLESALVPPEETLGVLRLLEKCEQQFGFR